MSAGRDSEESEKVRSPSVAVTETAALRRLRKVEGMLDTLPSSSVNSEKVAATEPADSRTICVTASPSTSCEDNQVRREAETLSRSPVRGMSWL